MTKIVSRLLICLLLLALIGPVLFKARAGREGDPQESAELRGTVLDETNAYIVGAKLTLEDESGYKRTTQSDDRGHYRIAVKPGAYILTVEVEGFAKFIQPVDLTSKRQITLDPLLKVQLTENVEIKDNSAMVSTEPDQNLSAITITEKDLDALPDDPDELLTVLKQMAGAAGAGDDVSIYVGGFRERGQLPPKEAILRININQNPFSAEYSEPGSSRIEIVLKPGADTFHGSFRFNFNSDELNARGAFFPTKPDMQRRNYSGTFSGPLIKNRWSFFFDIERREEDDSSLVNATVLDPVTFQALPFTTTVQAPLRFTNFSIRSDYLATKKHTIGIQFRRTDNERLNQGLSGFDLPTRVFNSESIDNTLRFSLTTIATEHTVNEFRLQASQRETLTKALNTDPTIQVTDSFIGGGNQGQLFLDNKNRNLDLADNLTYTHKAHTIKAGFRAEALQYKNINQSNFGGTFTFGSDFLRDATGQPILGPDGATTPISGLDLYRFVLQGVPGYHPSQFSIIRGDPFIGFSQWVFGWYVQDDWKISPRLSVSYGLRHEFQTHLQDRLNFAPRISIAFAPDKARKSTIRAGAGVFFNGLDSGITADTTRLDGEHQQQFVILAPPFFADVPGDLTGAVTRASAIHVKQQGLQDPYVMIANVGYDRQLPWKMVGSVSYWWTRGVHLLRARNINAPLFDGGNLVFPFPDQGPILEVESNGRSVRNEIRFNLRSNISRNLSLFAGYTLAYTHSDTDGASSSPANPYDLSIEYGRASNDVRHQFFVGGQISLPKGIRLSPYLFGNSGRPFNIVTGRDNNRDTVFADRPAFANVGVPGAIVTPFGVFNPDPRPGDVIIPRNFGQGPGYFNVNLAVSKTIGFGPPPVNWGRVAVNGQPQDEQGGQPSGRGGARPGNRGPGGGPRGGGFGGGGFGGGGGRGSGGRGAGPGGDARHKYNLTLTINATNIFNHTNLMNYIGTLTSPFFGLANRAQPSRRIEGAIRFNF